MVAFDCLTDSLKARVASIERVRLDLTGDPLEVLRRTRGQHRVAALLGAWHAGAAIITWDPLVDLVNDPFEDIHLPSVESPGDGFGGGWIGIWGYQLGGRLERLPQPPHRPRPQPHHRIAFYDRILRFTDGVWWFERLAGDPLDLFCAGLQRLRPAYAAFVSSPEGAVASMSPELFLRRTGDDVLTSPIKGTAALDTDPTLLASSPKDRAENVSPRGLELNVAIRTFEFADGRVWLGVGGGVVNDSTPAGEYQECLIKAGPLITAIGATLAGPP